MLNCQQSTAGIQKSLSLKAGVGFGCQFIKSMRTLPASTRMPLLLLCSLDPDEQSIEERATLLLSDPLNLWVAKARVQGLAVAKRLRAHLVGARAYAHLESHLSLVAAVRTGVPKSVWGQGESSVSGLFPCFLLPLYYRLNNKGKNARKQQTSQYWFSLFSFCIHT